MADAHVVTDGNW